MSGPTSALPQKLLIVEDDDEIGTLLRVFLQREGFETELARSGIELEVLRHRQGFPALFVLDLMLPGEDGLSICRRLRALRDTPIIMLTAKADDIDRIVGLELGADDYLAKPFSPRELVARIRAILRRAQEQGTVVARAETLHFAGFTLDSGVRRLRDASGKEIELLGGEYELLMVFLQRPQQVLTREQLMDWLKGRSWASFDRSIDVAVSRLRRKIELDPAQPALIKTVRNGGYVFSVAVEHR